jgi:hypothetical protein
MNTAIRWGVFSIALCLVLPAFATIGVGAEETRSVDPQVCAAEDPRDLTDENARWRLRAYRHLDCLISKLEVAMDRPSTAGKDNVSLSREEAEQLRTLAWWAKDAAARIGR